MKLASLYLAKVIIDRTSNNATEFVRKLITEVNSNGLKKVKGIVGNYFEVNVEKFLSDGIFYKSRRLFEPAHSAFDATFRRIICWQQPLRIAKSNISDVGEALLECTRMDTLYCFCKTIPPIDFAANGFTIIFQAINSYNPGINLKSILAICNHVRITRGANAKVFLIFVVPEAIVCDANWRYAQSFCYYEEEDLTEGFLRCVLIRNIASFMDYQKKEELTNLEQYVLCYS